jgi:hypothetical protein
MLRISMAVSVVLACGAMLVVAVSSATATQGQAVIAGQYNTSTAETVVIDTDAGAPCIHGAEDGLVGSGFHGVSATGDQYGVEAEGDTGVFGEA